MLGGGVFRGLYKRFETDAKRQPGNWHQVIIPVTRTNMSMMWLPTVFLLGNTFIDENFHPAKIDHKMLIKLITKLIYILFLQTPLRPTLFLS